VYLILLVIILLIFAAALVTYFILKRRLRVKLTNDEYNLLITRKFDQFELRSFLVRGDFNTTFRALDLERNKMVALRILDRKYIYNDGIVQQFYLKGEMLKYLSERFTGNYFVQNINYGTARVEDEPRPYIVSDQVMGVSLSKVLDECGKLSPRDVFNIIKQVGEAVSHAHSQRIWIREIAPQNVLLRIDDAGKLIATVANVGVPFKNLPSESAAELKKGYYSPEDRRGETVSEQSDIYALAALTFRALEGYDLSERQEGDPWKGVTGILEPALAEDPGKRTPNVEGFIKSLSTLATAPSSLKDQRWNILLARLMKEQSKVKVQRSGEESIAQGPTRRHFIPAIGKQTREKFVSAFITGLVTAFVLWLGKKVEGVFASPKKAIKVALVGVGAIAIALWYFVFSPPRTTVSVFTQPTGAAVSINGIQLGETTPLKNQSVDTGKVSVRVQKKGCFSVDTSIFLARGEHSDLTFMLKAAAVLSISINPPDALIVFDKDTLGALQLANFETSPGKHTIIISKQGYLPQQQEFDLKEGSNNPLVYTLAVNETPGLSITCDQPGAQLWINDQLVGAIGALPYKNDKLQAGVYQIKITMDGYTDFMQPVEIQQGKPVAVDAKLQQAGLLSITPKPQDARLVLDGKEIPNAPLPLKIGVGSHKIKLRKEGFKDFDTALTIDFKQTSSIVCELTPYSGQITVFVKPYGTIYYDENVLKTDGVFYTGNVPSGKHSLKVTHPTLGKWIRDVNLGRDKNLEIRIDFNVSVKLRVTSSDESGNAILGAEIFIDSKTVGKTTPAEITVQTGFHTIEVRRDGYSPIGNPISGTFDEDLKEPLKLTLKKNK